MPYTHYTFILLLLLGLNAPHALAQKAPQGKRITVNPVSPTSSSDKINDKKAKPKKKKRRFKLFKNKKRKATTNNAKGSIAIRKHKTTVIRPKVVDDVPIIVPNPKGSQLQNSLLQEAHKHLGTPYIYGGNTPKGFDCSGFVQYVYRNKGVQLPRVSRDQAKVGVNVSPQKAQKGDLIFFGDNKNSISHVGVINSNKNGHIHMIHASSSEGITITNINNSSYWQQKMQFVKRVIP
jgi:cell wall-associated NlpC family hydrolase